MQNKLFLNFTYRDFRPKLMLVHHHQAGVLSRPKQALRPGAPLRPRMLHHHHHQPALFSTWAQVLKAARCSRNPAALPSKRRWSARPSRPLPEMDVPSFPRYLKTQKPNHFLINN